MKRVLILSASPRAGGNTELLCDAVAEGVRSAGGEPVRLDVGRMKIAPCTGCDVCRRTGVCVQKDDMAEVIAEISRADAVVFGSPVYMYNLSAQLKAVMDRCYQIYPGGLSGRKTALVAVAGGDAIEETAIIPSYRGFLACFREVEDLGAVTAVCGNARGAVAGLPAMDEAQSLGARLCR
ncbi:MAG TPA: flavodoxin family protein [Candidatus Acidoferrum sp.]|nr:flavodoxin family protein [Candidatus Acidoferrum sp.]